MTDEELGPISTQERRDHRSQLGSDFNWKRPTVETAAAVWALSDQELPIQIESLMPKRRSAGQDNTFVVDGKQSLDVALDCAFTAWRPGRDAHVQRHVRLPYPSGGMFHFRRTVRDGTGAPARTYRGSVSTTGGDITRPGMWLKQEIPIRTFTEWDDARPGLLEVDLVAHCGSSTQGFYLCTLCA